MAATSQNARLNEWVNHWASIMQPDSIYWCDGSDEEYGNLTDGLVASGTFTRLNDEVRPNSFWAHSDPGDVARVEDRTFICSADQADAGPNNNWREPAEMRADMIAGLRGWRDTPTVALS